MPLGGAIIEQNIKLPLTTIEYYDIKCYILQMNWCPITQLCMYHRDHDLKVLKKFWDSVTLWSKVIMKFQINANSFLWILPIVMRLVLPYWPEYKKTLIIRRPPLFPDVPFGKRLFENQILFCFFCKTIFFLNYFHIAYFSYFNYLKVW